MTVELVLGNTAMSHPSRKRSVTQNLLQEMRRDGAITHNRRGQGALWELAKPGEEPRGLAGPGGDSDSSG